MKLISHRGNIDRPIPENENRMDYIQKAIDDGYDVEIDVRRMPDGLWLGHDGPEHPVSLSFLMDRKDKLWIHTKNFEALDYLINFDLRVFYHQLENHTVIGNSKIIWSHNLLEASEKSIIPLISMADILRHEALEMKFYGICSDHISSFKGD